MGLLQVATNTVTSAVSSFELTGINTDDVYMVAYSNAFMSSDGARLRVRFTVSGSADTSANYDNARKDMYANQSFSNAAGTNLTYLNGFSLGTTNPESSKGLYYLYNFNNSSEYSFVTLELQETNYAGENAGLMGGAVLTVAQACDGIHFFASTGNIASGTFTLYKVT
tara:strand:- start:33 stop:536 length:504 start_codon:yes stop_codon:yes gene_type:complete